ncbi:MAG TPA: hypothetical protein VFQ50_06920 [Flavobacterium sp.]|jgi:hypothetical protein|nr:hypothetical protein [Flavobacterium sp.]
MNTKKSKSAKKPTLENMAELMTGLSSKRIQVRKRQFIRNLLKTNRNLLENNNINSLILF